ncbi:hypothetical protein BJ684DRAFT_21340 [Piptocephalis cylindrospora]|uniref:MARVEL domain-containing protein n=1 Tax=Piptocephalis cylindrospora TaxID=1907219 RepID=A0A4P9Y001_9FUNG|nr:hypothetical protein BJ684DRAFT_21340 [Piptocephalis cylindrospora]|eukprot:RKP12096.1 hypothetical protein BJ684DRAFT_21340 [Piptocephalis cylindrospora]
MPINPWAKSKAQPTRSPSTATNAWYGQSTTSATDAAPVPGSMPMPEPENVYDTPMAPQHGTYSSNMSSSTSAYPQNTYSTTATTSALNPYGQSSAYQEGGDDVPPAIVPPPERFGGGEKPGKGVAGAAPVEPVRPLDDTGLGRKERPSVKRLILRFIILLCSIGALGFLAGAKPYSGHSNPFDSDAGIIFLYIISALSILVSLFFILHYCVRRVTKRTKMRRWIVGIIDLILALAFGVDVLVMIIHQKCGIGLMNGWCDFYNTALAFGFMAFFFTGISVLWDVFGTCANCKRRRR